MKTILQLRLLLSGVLLMTALIVLTGSAQAAVVEPPPVPAADAPASTDALGPSCRYGVAALSQAHLKWMDPLAAGWFLNFGPNGDSSGRPEFAPVIRIRQTKQGCAYLNSFSVNPPLTPEDLGAAVLSRPGHMWIVGNEPDRGPNPESCTQGVQDDTYPEVYARAYHDVYHYIKRLDPTARVSNAGLVQVTPGRLQYLDKVWNTYKALYGTEWPVDVWNMHLYVLPELSLRQNQSGQWVWLPNGIAGVAVGTDPALGIRDSNNDKNQCADPNVYCWAEHDDINEFKKQIVAMRTWMKGKGQQAKPLMLSEFSLLYPYIVDSAGNCFADEYGNCFTPQRVRDFANSSMAYLESAVDPNLGYWRDGNRLVQRWLWFSIYNDGVGSASNLANAANTAFTLPGQAFADRASAAPRYLNLFPAATYGVVAPPSSGLSTATLFAEIRNIGANETSGKTTVSFYADAALTQLIGSTKIVERLRGCEANGGIASVQWPGRPAGRWDYWVVVDSDQLWEESNEADNVLKGSVVVGSKWTFLPQIRR
jgi:hypothetical protein